MSVILYIQQHGRTHLYSVVGAVCWKDRYKGNFFALNDASFFKSCQLSLYLMSFTHLALSTIKLPKPFYARI